MAKATDTVLGQCVLRAGRAYAEEQIAGGRDPHRPPNRRETMRAIWSSTNTGSRVASLIVMWAIALMDEERDEMAIEEFAAWSAESRSTVHRRLREFRQLWPEYRTPNEIAVELVRQAQALGRRPGVDVRIPVAA